MTFLNAQNPKIVSLPIVHRYNLSCCENLGLQDSVKKPKFVNTTDVVIKSDFPAEYDRRLRLTEDIYSFKLVRRTIEF